MDQSLSREAVIERNERPIDRIIQEGIRHEEGWPYRVFPLLDNPFNNAIPSYFYPSVGGYSGAKLAYYQDLIDEAIFSGQRGLNMAILDMLNVRYITLSGQAMIPGLETVYTGNDGVLLENVNVLPKAFFVDSVSVLENQPEVLQHISRDFEAGKLAYVAEPLSYEHRPDTTSSVQVSGYNANRISVELERNEPGFLVLSEIWYPPGWRAQLNGEEIELIRTNYVLRGFEIPPGNHTLELILEPVWYNTGNRLAMIGTILLFGSGLYGFFIFWKRREEIQPTPAN